jgi:hypothetical protein
MYMSQSESLGKDSTSLAPRLRLLKELIDSRRCPVGPPKLFARTLLPTEEHALIRPTDDRARVSRDGGTWSSNFSIAFSADELKVPFVVALGKKRLAFDSLPSMPRVEK